MAAAADDWRLRNQEVYLKGAVLVWREWSPPPASNVFDRDADRAAWESPDSRALADEAVESLEQLGWDHDHCDFCWGTFTAPGMAGADPDSLTAGYSLQSARRSSPWICARCFEDFRERFGWTVATGGSI